MDTEFFVSSLLSRLHSQTRGSIITEMKFPKTVLPCLSASGVSGTKKMQILRTEFALMRRGYYQEKEKCKIPRRNIPVKRCKKQAWTSLKNAV